MFRIFLYCLRASSLNSLILHSYRVLIGISLQNIILFIELIQRKLVRVVGIWPFHHSYRCSLVSLILGTSYR